MVDLGCRYSDKYCTVVEFLVLVVESAFTRDIESFVDLCFDVVFFVTALTEKFQKFISALFKIVIGGEFLPQGYMGFTFSCGWGDRMSLTDIGGCQWI